MEGEACRDNLGEEVERSEGAVVVVNVVLEIERKAKGEMGMRSAIQCKQVQSTLAYNVDDWIPSNRFGDSLFPPAILSGT